MNGRARGRGVAAVIGFGALFVTWNSAVHAQTTTPTISITTIDAVQVAKPPVIDGTVAETEWQDAAVASSFIQFEPRRGERSDIRTESLVLYDAGHLYIAFRAWDSEPVTAQLTQRDAELLRDDAVVVVVDTTITAARPTTSSPTRWNAGRRTHCRRRAHVRGNVGRAGGSCGEADDRPVVRNPASACRRSGTPCRVGNAGGSTSGGAAAAHAQTQFLEWAARHPVAGVRGRTLTGLTVPAPLTGSRSCRMPSRAQGSCSAPDWEAGLDARYAPTPTIRRLRTLLPLLRDHRGRPGADSATRFRAETPPEKREFFWKARNCSNQRFLLRYRTFYL